MNIFKRIGQGIKKAVSNIFGRTQKAAPQHKAAPPPPQPKAAPQPQRPKTGDEVSALRRAVEMLIEADKHAGDPTYERAREKALVYINKSQRLAGVGATQSGNRRYIADQYLDDELSTAEGVEARKEKMLATFNANFGFDLSREQADTVGELMKSSSFKKLMETYKEKYDILIEMVGDNVELGVDPIRLEKQLTIWQENNINPEYDDFQKVTALSDEDFDKMYAQINEYNEENVHADEYERQQAVEGIMGGYIKW